MNICWFVQFCLASVKSLLNLQSFEKPNFCLKHKNLSFKCQMWSFHKSHKRSKLLRINFRNQLIFIFIFHHSQIILLFIHPSSKDILKASSKVPFISPNLFLQTSHHLLCVTFLQLLCKCFSKHLATIPMGCKFGHIAVTVRFKKLPNIIL